ncbi:MAG TPA: hypothetical protein VFX91_13540 [Alcanivorax sp.]|nr:hypothetical protein [Alcanivorax sp.]
MKDDYAVRPSPALSEEPVPDDGPQVETTAEELQGFYIVRAILSDEVDINRIIERDTLSYINNYV